MFTLSATCLAIRSAKFAGNLRIEERTGRFGQFWAICDDRGLIEVALTRFDADQRVSNV